MCFVRLLKHWHKEQTMQIKWGKHFSEPFHVPNGVGQGGALSSYLLAVYLVHGWTTCLRLRSTRKNFNDSRSTGRK